MCPQGRPPRNELPWVARPHPRRKNTCQRKATTQTNTKFRGYSLVVKFQSSKLAMRVRFPLPALCLYQTGFADDSGLGKGAIANKIANTSSDFRACPLVSTVALDWLKLGGVNAGPKVRRLHLLFHAPSLFVCLHSAAHNQPLMHQTVARDHLPAIFAETVNNRFHTS